MAPITDIAPLFGAKIRCQEPRHMHVDRDRFSGKLWLNPDVLIADNHGYSRRELREIERLAREHLEKLRHAWDEFCSDPSGNA